MLKMFPAGFGMKIFTVGYGGRKPDDFIALLEKHNVQLVVDVRLKTNRAFRGVYVKSKDSHKGIQGLLEKANIQYIWVAELGNMFKDIDDWHEKYRRYLDEKGELACSKLYKIKMPFCLMCCEKRALGCHRKLIADYLVNRGYEVEHLE
jgi:uncharacterized protein (DUF488 family)